MPSECQYVDCRERAEFRIRYCNSHRCGGKTREGKGCKNNVNCPAHTRNDTLTLYYLPGCIHCKDFLPTFKLFQKLAVDKFPGILVEYLNCALNPPGSENIKGVPTTIFHNGVKSVEFKGERTIRSLVQFCEDMRGGGN